MHTIANYNSQRALQYNRAPNARYAAACHRMYWQCIHAASMAGPNLHTVLGQASHWHHKAYGYGYGYYGYGHGY